MNYKGLLNKAINLHLSGKKNKAARIYEKIIELEQSNIIALNNFASLLIEIGDFYRAKLLLKKALKIKPNYLDALNNLGISTKLSQKYLEAIKIFEKIIELNPSYLKAYINLGDCLQSQKKFKDALEVYDKAIKLDSKSTEVLFNKGTCLNELNLQDKAKTYFEKILKINPKFVEARWCLALIQLQQENYIEGWQNYEARKIRNKTKNNYSDIITSKNWLEEKELNNKKIYIKSEQGLGDYIQFSRYLSIIENLGAKIILDVPKPLKKIINTLGINYTHIDDIDKLEFDYFCYLMSLPLILNTKINTIPNKTPYLYTPEVNKKHWKEKLGSKITKRIGLVWSGSSLNENDHNRSIKLKTFMNLFELPFEFHSLQIEYNEFDLKLMKKLKNLINHKNEIKGFDNTAGLIESLDLVISVDTSIVHLSGALNKPTWLLLPFTPDFRWLLKRSDSPWYPSIKLYRQEKKGNWETVINKVKKDLINL